jgi:hypothetical protein
MIEQINIEFDGEQVAVRTDVAELRDYLGRTYELMLSEQNGSAIGHLEITRLSDGFAFRGESELDYAGDVSGLYEYLKYELLVQFIRKRQDLLWLHAAAVERGGKALIVAGPSGQGKAQCRLVCARWDGASCRTTSHR